MTSLSTILGRNNEEPPKPGLLFSHEELIFIVSKLREGTYRGVEFEIFYQVMVKLEQENQK